MNALELHKLIHEGVKTVNTVNAPVIQKIKPESVSPNLIPDIHHAKVNQSQSSIPLIKCMLIVGAIILGIYLNSKIQKSENNLSYFDRMRKRA